MINTRNIDPLDKFNHYLKKMDFVPHYDIYRYEEENKTFEHQNY